MIEQSICHKFYIANVLKVKFEIFCTKTHSKIAEIQESALCTSICLKGEHLFYHAGFHGMVYINLFETPFTSCLRGIVLPKERKSDLVLCSQGNQNDQT
jgi:hypothetical protein